MKKINTNDSHLPEAEGDLQFKSFINFPLKWAKSIKIVWHCPRPFQDAIAAHMQFTFSFNVFTNYTWKHELHLGEHYNKISLQWVCRQRMIAITIIVMIGDIAFSPIVDRVCSSLLWNRQAQMHSMSDAFFQLKYTRDHDTQGRSNVWMCSSRIISWNMGDWMLY